MQIKKSDSATVRHESFVLPINTLKSFSGAAQYNDGYTLTGHIQDGLFGLNNKAYRGGLWLHTFTTAAFSAINVLNLEDYLLSVVPSEMPSSWPLEALKAQAIAARSYALANLGKHGSQGFDVKADTEDQMYTGVLAETEASNRAVAETAGIVIKNQGKIVPAFYHSTSGGSTEIALGKDYPFLQEVADYDDASPKFTWTKKMSIYDLAQALKNKTHKDPIGQPQNITVLSRSPANNTLKILVTGDLGSVELSGEQSRALFGLPSSSFNAAIDSSNQLCVFSGRGFGHRMGLSQWGAKALAEHGYNAAQILGYYYKDVSLEYP
jgi:stage II sporulation protein D